MGRTGITHRAEGYSFELLDDGSIDTVVEQVCPKGHVQDVRISGDVAGWYRDPDSGTLENFAVLVEEQIFDGNEPCIHCDYHKRSAPKSPDQIGGGSIMTTEYRATYRGPGSASEVTEWKNINDAEEDGGGIDRVIWEAAAYGFDRVTLEHDDGLGVDVEYRRETEEDS